MTTTGKPLASNQASGGGVGEAAVDRQTMANQLKCGRALMHDAAKKLVAAIELLGGNG